MARLEKKHYFKLIPIQFGMDEDGDVLQSCVVEYTDQTPQKKQTQKDVLLEVLDEMLNSQGERRFIVTAKMQLHSVEIDKVRDLLKCRDFSKSETDWDNLFRRTLRKARNENILDYNNDHIWRQSSSEHIAELT